MASEKRNAFTSQPSPPNITIKRKVGYDVDKDKVSNVKRRVENMSVDDSS